MKRYLFFILILCIALTSCFFNDVKNSGSENPPTTPTNNYLLSYNFDESSGNTAFDSSGNGANGALSSVMRTDGKVNRAVSFSSENSLVRIDRVPLLLDYLGSLTIYSWIKLTELNSTKQYIILKEKECDFGLSIKIINNQLRVLCSNNMYLQSLTILETDKWIHFVLTSDGNRITLYLNGLEDCSTHITFPAVNSECQYLIGGSGNSCLGVIDEFNIMKIALTADQVQELYLKY